MSPSLALVDIALTGMDGYAVCRMLRDDSKSENMPVILISGKDGWYEENRGEACGASGFITKPFGPETLMRTVESFLPTVG
jgi:twitching motility two-component system response regulator PilG